MLLKCWLGWCRPTFFLVGAYHHINEILKSIMVYVHDMRIWIHLIPFIIYTTYGEIYNEHTEHILMRPPKFPAFLVRCCFWQFSSSCGQGTLRPWTVCLGKNIAIKDCNAIPKMVKKNNMRSTKSIQNKKEPLGDYVASCYAIYVGRGLYGYIYNARVCEAYKYGL